MKIQAVTFNLFILLVMSMFTQIPNGSAQSSILLKLPAHSDISKVSWRDSIYRFPEFKYGRITLATGFSPKDTLRLNYNLYFAQMDMINGNGDTVQVTPSKELKLIEIDGCIFYHDDRRGYIEVLSQAPIALGVLTILNTEKMEYVSGTFDGTSAGMDTRGTTSVYDRYYRNTATYFFIDKNNKLYKALRPSVLKLFPSHKKTINKYLDENETDFNNKENLLQLLTFCNGL